MTLPDFHHLFSYICILHLFVAVCTVTIHDGFACSALEVRFRDFSRACLPLIFATWVCLSISNQNSLGLACSHKPSKFVQLLFYLVLYIHTLSLNCSCTSLLDGFACDGEPLCLLVFTTWQSWRDNSIAFRFSIYLIYNLSFPPSLQCCIHSQQYLLPAGLFNLLGLHVPFHYI